MAHRRLLFAASLLAATCFSAALAQESSSAANSAPQYLDTKLPARERAHDIVSRMTLEEKAQQLEDWATAIPRLGVPRLPDMERVSARRGAGRLCDGLSAGDRDGGYVGRGDGARDGKRHLRRGARQVQPGAARRQSPHLLRAGLSGRRTSTSFATRAGAADRRPTAKTLT